MKNIIDTINSDNKNMFEGFFDNVDATPFKALNDFLKENKNFIVTLKGKDYLIHNLLIYDVDDLRAVVRDLIDRSSIKMNKDLKKYRTVDKVEFNDHGGLSSIVISYKYYALSNIENNIEPVPQHHIFYSIGAVSRKDEYLIDFLKKIAK